MTYVVQAGGYHTYSATYQSSLVRAVSQIDLYVDCEGNDMQLTGINVYHPPVIRDVLIAELQGSSRHGELGKG